MDRYALARTEVARALLVLGPAVLARGEDALARLDVMRVSDCILRVAGTMLPLELRPPDAIHLASAAALGG